MKLSSLTPRQQDHFKQLTALYFIPEETTHFNSNCATLSSCFYHDHCWYCYNVRAGEWFPYLGDIHALSLYKAPRVFINHDK